MDVSGWLRKQLEEASPDLLRAMVQEMAEALMGAEVDELCGAPYGERSPERVNRRNGYRERDWDTRVGSIELAVPKLREGSYFPDWLLQPRRRAEQAFVSVIADAYLAGVSTRRVEKLVQQLVVERMSKSQVSRLAKSLDQIVEDFRTRPLDGDAVRVRDLRRAGREVPRGRPHRRPARNALPRSRGAARRRGARPARLHLVPQGALAPALEQQLTRAAQQGDPAPHRRRRDLPQPRRCHPPGRRRPRRTTRRMG